MQVWVVCVCVIYIELWSFQDELARVLVTLFDSRHLLYQLLWNMFSKEVELADSMQTLFRGNSLASKIMTFCFKVPLRFPWRALKSNDHSKRQMIQLILLWISLLGTHGHSFFQVYGATYLQKLLEPLLRAVITGTEWQMLSFEVDLTRYLSEWTLKSVICNWYVSANSPVTC